MHKDNITEKAIIVRLKGKPEIDICEEHEQYFPHGIGYRELRFCVVDDNNHLVVESNNEHDYEKGEDCYQRYGWDELTDYEKETLYLMFVENHFV